MYIKSANLETSELSLNYSPFLSPHIQLVKQSSALKSFVSIFLLVCSLCPRQNFSVLQETPSSLHSSFTHASSACCFSVVFSIVPMQPKHNILVSYFNMPSHTFHFPYTLHFYTCNAHIHPIPFSIFLLRYNIDRVKFTLFQCTVLQVLTDAYSCITTTSVKKIQNQTHKFSYALSQSTLFLTYSPWQPLIGVLSLQFCFFPAYHINGFPQLLSLASFTQHDAFEIHPGFRTCSSLFIFIAGQYFMTWMNHSLFIHPCLKEIFGEFPIFIPSPLLTAAYPVRHGSVVSSHQLFPVPSIMPLSYFIAVQHLELNCFARAVY